MDRIEDLVVQMGPEAIDRLDLFAGEEGHERGTLEFAPGFGIADGQRVLDPERCGDRWCYGCRTGR